MQKAGFSDDAATLSDIVIAGATRTSEPVTKAVDTALKQIAVLAGETGVQENTVTEEESK